MNNDLNELTAKAESGDAEAQLLLGESRLEKGRLREALDLFERAAENGNAKANYHLAFAYFNGTGVEKNLGKSAEYLKLSAEGEYIPAMAQLGSYYIGGIGVARDEQMALFWTRRAAKENDPLGVYNLGIAYLEGLGMPKNRDKAILTLQKAVTLGNEKAQEVLDKILTEDDKTWLAERDEETSAEERETEAAEELSEEELSEDENGGKTTEKKSFLSRLKSWFTGE